MEGMEVERGALGPKTWFHCLLLQNSSSFSGVLSYWSTGWDLTHSVTLLGSSGSSDWGEAVCRTGERSVKVCTWLSDPPTAVPCIHFTPPWRQCNLFRQNCANLKSLERPYRTYPCLSKKLSLPHNNICRNRIHPSQLNSNAAASIPSQIAGLQSQQNESLQPLFSSFGVLCCF